MPNYALAFADANVPLRLYTLVDPNNHTPSWSGFLLSKQSDHTEEQISLDDAWDEKGHFLFSYTAPELSKAYLEALQAYLIDATAQRVKTSITFILDPTASPSAETVQIIPIYQKGTNDYRLADPSLFDIGNGFMKVQVGPNDIYGSVRVDAKTHGNYGELQLSLQSEQPISLHINGMLLTNQSTFPVSVPVNGPGAGCLRFGLGLNLDNHWTGIDLQQKHFFPQGDSFGELNYPLFRPGLEAWEIQFQVSLDPTDLVNKRYSDPLLRRSYFAFTGQTVNTHNVTSDNAFPTVLESYYYSAAGYPINLHPVQDTVATEAQENTFYPSDKNACLVLSERDTGPGAETPYYLVPSGNFLIEVVPQDGEDAVKNGQTRWLAGLSGLETLQIRVKTGSQEGDHLRFLANKPAYAPQFPRVAASHLNRPDPNPALQSTFETAWANILSYSGEEVLFYSQPEGGSLYVRDAETNADGLLDFYETAVRLSPDIHFSFPMVPHGGLTDQVDLIAQFADEVLSPFRKETINSLNAPYLVSRPPSVEPNTLIDSVSPQGLITNLGDDGQWKELILAQHYELANLSDPQFLDLRNGIQSANPPNFKLSFLNLPRPLQNALQANQLFLPITDLSTIGMRCFDEIEETIVNEEAVFNNKVVVQEWPFQINVGKRYKLGDYNNVLIFKFCRGKLSDWTKNPKQWIQAPDFNIANADQFELHLLSRWLQDYFAEAQEQVDNPYFAYFNSLIDDPNWTGILALKVDVAAEEFPDQLKGLVAGIDLDKFNAHHLGIEVNHIDTTADQLTIENSSSIFGLIYYVDPAYQAQVRRDPSLINTPVAAAPGTYDFKVLTLQVLFENTAIKDFASKIQVTMRTVFGDTILEEESTITENPRVSLLLDGAYEEKNGLPSYTFQSDQPTKLWTDSGVINFFEFERASFQTFPQAVDSTLVQSRFTFAGNINFRSLGTNDLPFDLFSFGSIDGAEAGDSRQGLIFRNLLLDMEFDLENPSIVAFANNTSDIRFDPNNSPLRAETALFNRFPLDYRTFLLGAGGESPADLGYLPAFTPNLQVSTLGEEWYGIDFDLDLGSPGALAEEAGFKANFLVAWSPGYTRSSGIMPVFVGVKLPGSGGNGKLLSLQSVVKLSIADIEFLYENGAYVLKFNDLGIKFFGLLKLPPSGNTNFYLFGDPNATDKPKNVGWYAAYNKIPEDTAE